MTADDKIKRVALIAIVLGWPSVGLLYLTAGFNPAVDWSVIALIGVTTGLALRWLTDWWGRNSR